jgi:hypothetical protein
MVEAEREEVIDHRAKDHVKAALLLPDLAPAVDTNLVPATMGSGWLSALTLRNPLCLSQARAFV